MQYTIKEIKEGIKAHYIKTDLFKTNLVAIFITTKLEKNTATINTLIPAVLRRGTQELPSQEEISKVLENMYGATFDCGIDKIGDNQVLKFYLEALNNKFLLDNEDLLKESMNHLLKIVLNPLLENGVFKEEYVTTEKQNICQLIESKIDNKEQYSVDKCIEIMYEGKPYGIYKYGDAMDIEKITTTKLYDQYEYLKEYAKIDIFISGDFNPETVDNILQENSELMKLKARKAEYIENNEETEKKEKSAQTKIQQEKLEVTQGKIVMGLDILKNEKNTRYAIALYNVLLGGSTNSKLFQNVREKASLAYSAGSSYIKQKNTIIIKAGIEIENYEKALDIIKQQIEAMKNGDFTEDELEKAKKYMVYGIKAIIDEQDTGITYYLGQELAGTNVSPEEYIDSINAVTKEEIKQIANNVQINTIYFLRN